MNTHWVWSATLTALDLLIAKTGNKWKYHLRRLKGPEFYAQASRIALLAKGMSAGEISAMQQVSDEFIEKATRSIIRKELQRRRAAGIDI